MAPIRLCVYLEQIPDPRTRKLLSGRLDGLVLNTLAEEIGITAEGVRIIIKNTLSSRPRILEEEKYRSLFSKYDIRMDDFVSAFSEPAQTYRFLKLICKKGTTPLSNDVLADSTLSEELRTGLFKLLHRDQINVNGEYIPKTRSGISEYLMKTYFRETTELQIFYKKYIEFLREIGSEKDPTLLITEQGYSFQLFMSDYALHSLGYKLRYYDIHRFDFTAFLSTLALDQYHDAEYSARRFFLDHPDLMKEYDVRDEYELHNLLRKICPRYHVEGISFSRAPTIKFGKADREQQIYAILEANSSITKQEFLELYEKKYGVHPLSLKNILTPFEKYFQNDDLWSARVIPEDVHTFFKNSLTQDRYSLKEIQERYGKTLPDGSLLSLQFFKKMGFIICGDQVIHPKFQSTVGYFRGLLSTGDMVDFNEIPKCFLGRRDFYVVLNQMERDMELIECGPRRFLTVQGMKKRGIRKSALQRFQKDVISLIPQDTYFTIHWLRKHFDFSYLGDIPDAVCAAFLSRVNDEFKSCRFAGVRILLRGKDSALVNDFLRQVISAHGPIKIDRLLSLLTHEFGIKQKKEDLTSRIRKSSMFLLDPIQIVYLQEDIFDRNSVSSFPQMKTSTSFHKNREATGVLSL